MITFYSLSKIDNSDDFWARVNNIDAVLSITLAKMLNEDEKYKIINACNLHPGCKNEVGLIYTDNNIEFIVTVVCCESFKDEVLKEIEKLQPGLTKFFAGS